MTRLMDLESGSHPLLLENSDLDSQLFAVPLPNNVHPFGHPCLHNDDLGLAFNSVVGYLGALFDYFNFLGIDVDMKELEDLKSSMSDDHLIFVSLDKLFNGDVSAAIHLKTNILIITNDREYSSLPQPIADRVEQPSSNHLITTIDSHTINGLKSSIPTDLFPPSNPFNVESAETLSGDSNLLLLNKPLSATVTEILPITSNAKLTYPISNASIKHDHPNSINLTYKNLKLKRKLNDKTPVSENLADTKQDSSRISVIRQKKLYKKIRSVLTHCKDDYGVFASIWQDLQELGWKSFVCHGFYPIIAPWAMDSLQGHDELIRAINKGVDISGAMLVAMQRVLVKNRDYFMWTTGPTDSAMAYLREFGPVPTDVPITESKRIKQQISSK